MELHKNTIENFIYQITYNDGKIFKGTLKQCVDIIVDSENNDNAKMGFLLKRVGHESR